MGVGSPHVENSFNSNVLVNKAIPVNTYKPHLKTTTLLSYRRNDSPITSRDTSPYDGALFKVGICMALQKEIQSMTEKRRHIYEDRLN